MKLELALIRHGQAQSGPKKLIGITDKRLNEAGERLIREKVEEGAYPKSELVFSSGLSRCYKTAQIIYPNIPTVVLKELQALDYGDFESKSTDELATDESFINWAETKGTSACPNGEEPYRLKARSIAVFRRIVDEMALKGLKQSSIISHKMIIQEILQRYHVPRSNYTEWQIPHGGGYILKYDTTSSTAKIVSRI